MTPEHQELIDTVLRLAAARTAHLARQTDLPHGGRAEEQTLERLRASPLGVQLRQIAEYAEGYAYQGEGDIRAVVNTVVLTLFRDMLRQNTYRYPHNFHRTPLGRLFSQALRRFFRRERPGRLVKVAAAAQLCGVRRQTIHQWAEEGVLLPIYDEQGNVWFDRLDVERQQKKRSHPQTGA